MIVQLYTLVDFGNDFSLSYKLLLVDFFFPTPMVVHSAWVLSVSDATRNGFRNSDGTRSHALWAAL